jgi:hypothetical protein
MAPRLLHRKGPGRENVKPEPVVKEMLDLARRLEEAADILDHSADSDALLIFGGVVRDSARRIHVEASRLLRLETKCLPFSG